MKFKCVHLIAILAAFVAAYVSIDTIDAIGFDSRFNYVDDAYASIPIDTINPDGWNAEGVNVTILGIFSITGGLFENNLNYPVFVDMSINVSPDVRDVVVKIIDTEGVTYDLGTAYFNTLGALSLHDDNNLGHNRYVFGYDLPASSKMKYIKFEGTTGTIEWTPFLVKVNETPDIIIPYGSQVHDVYGQLIYLLNVTPNSTVDNISVDNISISPERIYVIPVGRHLSAQNDVVNWFVGMKVENKGYDPRLIRYDNFKFEDQYGWEYETLGFAGYNPHAGFENVYEYDEDYSGNGLDDHFTLLPGESLRIGLLLNKISGISMPRTVIYMGQSIKIVNVTTTTNPPPW